MGDGLITPKVLALRFLFPAATNTWNRGCRDTASDMWNRSVVPCAQFNHGQWDASFANRAIPKSIFFALAAVEVFTVTLQNGSYEYYQPGQLDQGFFKRRYSSITPLLPRLVTVRFGFPLVPGWGN